MDEIIGREEHLDALGAFVERARARSPQSLLLEGEAGHREDDALARGLRDGTGGGCSRPDCAAARKRRPGSPSRQSPICSRTPTRRSRICPSPRRGHCASRSCSQPAGESPADERAVGHGRCSAILQRLVGRPLASSSPWTTSSGSTRHRRERSPSPRAGSSGEPVGFLARPAARGDVPARDRPGTDAPGAHAASRSAPLALEDVHRLIQRTARPHPLAADAAGGSRDVGRQPAFRARARPRRSSTTRRASRRGAPPGRPDEPPRPRRSANHRSSRTRHERRCSPPPPSQTRRSTVVSAATRRRRSPGARSLRSRAEVVELDDGPRALHPPAPRRSRVRGVLRTPERRRAAHAVLATARRGSPRSAHSHLALAAEGPDATVADPAGRGGALRRARGVHPWLPASWPSSAAGADAAG